jgi:hypothetical protein
MPRSKSSISEILITIAVLFIALNVSGCGSNSASGGISNDSPTAAYKRLYAAVKSKDINAIKKEMSKQSNTLVAGIAAQQKKTVEEIYGNGLTSTLKSDELPEIRDERINGSNGAVEVYNNSEHKWNDIPFILEDGQWKLALGDAFANKYTWPGKGRDQREKEAANALNNNAPAVANGPANAPWANSAAKNANMPANK